MSMNATTPEIKSWWIVRWPSGRISIEPKPSHPAGSSKIATVKEDGSPGEPARVMSYHDTRDDAESAMGKLIA